MTKPTKIPKYEHGQMPYDEWVQEYKPKKNPVDHHASYEGCMLETYSDDYEVVTHYLEIGKENQIWTVVDVDGHLWIISGWHYVNRIGYIITQEPVPDNVIIEVDGE